MGTRGAYGFRIDGRDKITYCHLDSYPEHLGAKTISLIQRHDDAALRAIAERILLVDENQEPTAEQDAECRRVLDAALPPGRRPRDEAKAKTWFDLLGPAQGEPALLSAGLPYMTNDRDFLADSLFCEWAYVVNLDDGVLEIYRGFNKDPDAPGRYAALSADGPYRGVALLRTSPLREIREIPADKVKAYCDETEEIAARTRR